MKQVFVEEYDKTLDFYITTKEGNTYNNKLDKAIERSQKNILQHSIIEKGQEYCKWIDDSYLTIAKSYYYKKDYIKAKETLKYIIGTYEEDKVLFEASMLLVKCYIETKDIYFAKLEIEKINVKNKKQEKEVNKIHSYIDYLNNDIDNSIEKTKKYLSLENKKTEKTRHTYILAQLYEKQKKFTEAYENYKKVVKMSSDYDMVFNSKLKKAKVVDIQKNTTTEIEEELKQMLKDEKNTDYFYEIYLTLAELKLRKQDTIKSIEMFNMASKNIKQNNQYDSHLNLANIFYSKKEYTKAQKHYDSTLVFLSKKHKNYKNIKERQENLTDLVDNLQTIKQQDSLIMVSKMTEQNRNNLIDKIIQEVIKKEQEDARNNINQTGFGSNTNNLGLNSFTQNRINEEQTRQFGSNWYFYNNTTLTFGYSNFKKKWGKRKLEDNWRRQNKSTVSLEEYYAKQDSLQKENTENDPKKRETYLKNLPFEEEEKRQSYNKIITSMYRVAKIYQEKLNDDKFAEKYFLKIIQQYPNSKIEPTVLFNLYLFYKEKEDKIKQNKQIQTLYKKYPESKYSFFIKNNKTKTLEKDTLYRSFVDMWHQEKQEDIVNKYKQLSEENKKDPDISFIFTLAKGQLYGQKDMLIELRSIIEKHPNHEVSHKSKQILKNIKKEEKTVEKDNEQKQKTNKYVYKEKSNYYFLIIFPRIETSTDNVKNILSDFHLDRYSLMRLNVSDVVFGQDKYMVIVREFSSLVKISEYYNEIIKSPEIKTITNNQNDMFFISATNFQTFFQNQDLSGYKNFFKETY